MSLVIVHLTLSVILSAVVGVPDAPAASAFAGTWVLDPARGVLHDSRPREIRLSLEDDGQTVTVTERIPGKRDNRFVCRSDGTPSEQRSSSSVYRRVLRRESGALVWQNTMTRMGDDASISWTERWSVSEDARVLTIHKLFPGNREFLEIYRRSAP